MIRESEIAYAARLTLGKQIIEHTVIDIAVLVGLDTVIPHTHTVQQQIVDIVGLQLLERVVIHRE